MKPLTPDLYIKNVSLDTEWNKLVDLWHSSTRHTIEKIVAEARKSLTPHLLRTGRTLFTVSLKSEFLFEHDPQSS